jgi:hypothetical protein
MTEAQNKIKFLEAQNRSINEMLSSCQKNLYTLKNKGGRRRKKRGGGNVDLTFKKPEVSNTSASGAIQGTIHKQEAGNAEVVALNKAMAGGGDIVVPQMNQAGEAGNKSISGTIDTQLKGAAQAEYDNDVNIEPKPSGMPSGGRRKRRRRKTKRKKRKSKKRRRKRKTKKRKRKRKTKRRR